MAQKFSYEFVVLEGDLDSFGHVNNAVYLRFFEAARWDMVTSQGYGLSEIQKTGLGPVILEVKVKFKKELLLRERVCIESVVVAHTKVGAQLEQKLYNEKRELCAEALFSFALFDLKKRRLVAPTPAWIKALGLDPADLSLAVKSLDRV